MKVRSITTLTQRKTRDRYDRNIYRRVYVALEHTWENFFLKPLVVLFFVVQAATAFGLAGIMPLYMGLDLHVNVWLVLLYEVVVLYFVFLLLAFWYRVSDAY